MRVQHNIMAMSAYRNYTNNVAAMKKNLERLSSGYKINRAGDDAAGLAISEKMRAQITGLETAQKNAKDGISLVQTAEGALTEVHDMLNRMVELATMSANGTYDNETDRFQLQKELDQLRSEIDRIADSANFNGIKLLNGDMDGEAVTTAIAAAGGNFVIGGTGVGSLPAVASNPYADLGVNTVLHQDVTTATVGSSFGVNLHDFTFSNHAGDTMTIQIGDPDSANSVTIELIVDEAATGRDGTEADELTGQEIVDAILNGTGGGSGKSAGITVKVNGEEWARGDTFEINGQAFEFDPVNSVNDVLAFKQKAPPTDASEEVEAAMSVKLTGVTKATKAQYTVDLSKETWVDGDEITVDGKTFKRNNAASEWQLDGDPTTKLGTEAVETDDFEITLKDNTLTITAKEAGKADKPAVTYKKASVPIGADNPTTGVKGKGTVWTAIISGDANTSKSIITIEMGGEPVTLIGGTLKAGVNTTEDLTFIHAGKTYKVKLDGQTLTITGDSFEDETGDYRTLTIRGTDIGDTDIHTITTIRADEGKAEIKASATYDISGWTGGKLTIPKAGENGGNLEIDFADKSKIGTTIKEITVGTEVYVLSLSTDGKKLTITEKEGTEGGNVATAIPSVSYANAGDLKVTTVSKGGDDKEFGYGGAFVGDYNVQTVNPKTVKVDDNKRLASTWFELTEAMVQEGAKIRIGDTTYTFTTDKAHENEDPVEAKDGSISAYVYYKEGTSLTDIAKLFAQAAADNDVYSVGVDEQNPAKITLVEKVDYCWNDDGTTKYGTDDAPKYDLRTEKGIMESLGFKFDYMATTTDAPGKGLTLQIGDTADPWNQLVVNIRDTHCVSLGSLTSTDENGNTVVEDATTLADIKITDQESAATAVDVIKRAINQISDIRGTLGATQNRLDHTINNLSVMTENIQDAESTIRDTDIAEEMMAYTKNNILIQASQAMLAQANQVPQGVLQLLQ